VPFCVDCTNRRLGAFTMGPTKAPCLECKASAVLDPDNGMCAYCCTSTGHGDERRDEQDRIMRFSTDTHHGAEARKRLAAMDRAERPRGNPAQRKQMEKGPPSGWPSNEGED